MPNSLAAAVPPPPPPPGLLRLCASGFGGRAELGVGVPADCGPPRQPSAWLPRLARLLPLARCQSDAAAAAMVVDEGDGDGDDDDENGAIFGALVRGLARAKARTVVLAKGAGTQGAGKVIKTAVSRSVPC